MHPEIEKFVKWCYNEINNNEMVALGPLRFVAEHRSQKPHTVTPNKWLSTMAGMMSAKEEKGLTGVDVAKDFNQMIESGEIEKFILRSNKRIAEEAAAEYMANPEDFVKGLVEEQEKEQ